MAKKSGTVLLRRNDCNDLRGMWRITSTSPSGLTRAALPPTCHWNGSRAPGASWFSHLDITWPSASPCPNDSEAGIKKGKLGLWKLYIEIGAEQGKWVIEQRGGLICLWLQICLQQLIIPLSSILVSSFIWTYARYMWGVQPQASILSVILQARPQPVTRLSPAHLMGTLPSPHQTWCTAFLLVVAMDDSAPCTLPPRPAVLRRMEYLPS